MCGSLGGNSFFSGIWQDSVADGIGDKSSENSPYDYTKPSWHKPFKNGALDFDFGSFTHQYEYIA